MFLRRHRMKKSKTKLDCNRSWKYKFRTKEHNYCKTHHLENTITSKTSYQTPHWKKKRKKVSWGEKNKNFTNPAQPEELQAVLINTTVRWRVLVLKFSGGQARGRVKWNSTWPSWLICTAYFNRWLLIIGCVALLFYLWQLSHPLFLICSYLSLSLSLSPLITHFWAKRENHMVLVR